jgi:hypothetical protein
MTTFGIVRSSNGSWCIRRRPSTLSSKPWATRFAIVFTSPPAQKPRPAPVTTIAPTSALLPKRCSASPKASSIDGENAFSRSGRLRVNQAIPSSAVSSRSVIFGSCVGGFREQYRDRARQLRDAVS